MYPQFMNGFPMIPPTTIKRDFRYQFAAGFMQNLLQDRNMRGVNLDEENHLYMAEEACKLADILLHQLERRPVSKETYPKKCSACDKDFLPKPYRQDASRFCSTNCRLKSLKKSLGIKPTPPRKIGIEETL